jgi:hypothetical protein
MNDLEQQAREWYLIHYRHFTAKEAAEYRVHPGEQPTIGMLMHFAQHILSQHPPAPVKGLSVEQVMGVVKQWDIEASNDSFVEPATDTGMDELRSRLSSLSTEGGEPVSDVEPLAWMASDGSTITNQEKRRMSIGSPAESHTASGHSTPLYAHPPLPDVERLVEAGDAMADVLAYHAAQCGTPDKGEVEKVQAWSAAKSSILKSQPNPVQLSRDYEALYEHLCNGGEGLGFAHFRYPEPVGYYRKALALEQWSPGRSIAINGLGFSHEERDPFLAECQRLNLEWVAVKSSIPKKEG